MDSRLTREERLRGLSTIRTLFEADNSGFIYPLRYLWSVGVTDGGEAGETREAGGAGEAGETGCSVLFSVPKRNHRRANKRNLLKRRMRETYRLNKPQLLDKITEARGCHINLALIYSTKELHQYKTINRAIERILKEVVQSIKESYGAAANTPR